VLSLRSRGALARLYTSGHPSARQIEQLLGYFAGNLNLKLIPTKQNGVWQANTVKGILDCA